MNFISIILFILVPLACISIVIFIYVYFNNAISDINDSFKQVNRGISSSTNMVRDSYRISENYYNRISDCLKQSQDEAVSSCMKSYPSSGGSSAGVMIGTILMWPGRNIPDNFLLCDGKEYDVLTYPELWTVLFAFDFKPEQITLQFIIQQGLNPKFKVPDLIGKFVRGAGKGVPAGNTQAASIPSIKVTKKLFAKDEIGFPTVLPNTNSSTQSITISPGNYQVSSANVIFNSFSPPFIITDTGSSIGPDLVDLTNKSFDDAAPYIPPDTLGKQLPQLDGLLDAIAEYSNRVNIKNAYKNYTNTGLSCKDANLVSGGTVACLVPNNNFSKIPKIKTPEYKSVGLAFEFANSDFYPTNMALNFIIRAK